MINSQNTVKCLRKINHENMIYYSGNRTVDTRCWHIDGRCPSLDSSPLSLRATAEKFSAVNLERARCASRHKWDLSGGEPAAQPGVGLTVGMNQGLKLELNC